MNEFNLLTENGKHGFLLGIDSAEGSRGDTALGLTVLVTYNLPKDCMIQ